MNTKRLKIALVSDAVLPFHKGGKEMRIHQLALELVGLGQDVHLYTMQWWEGGKTHVHKGITYHALCRLYPLYVGNRRSFKEGIMFALACLKMIGHKFDVIETDHMPYFPLFTTKLVSLLKRKPLYATWHEVVGLQGWQAYLGGVSGRIAYGIERVSVMLPNHIIAVSEHTAKQLRTVLHYKGAVSHVSNGISHRQFLAIEPATAKSDIVYVGRLTPHKNVDMLIRAVDQVRASRPTVRCTIIGTGTEESKLRALVKELGLEKNVQLTGRIESHDDVYALMKASRVLVSPSFREGFGITVIEAFACGLTVVTVKHHDNAAQYLVKEGSGIVCEPTVSAVADSIKTLLAKPKPKKHPVDASAYDWSKQAALLKEAYGI